MSVTGWIDDDDGEGSSLDVGPFHLRASRKGATFAWLFDNERSVVSGDDADLSTLADAKQAARKAALDEIRRIVDALMADDQPRTGAHRALTAADGGP